MTNFREILRLAGLDADTRSGGVRIFQRVDRIERRAAECLGVSPDSIHSVPHVIP